MMTTINVFRFSFFYIFHQKVYVTGHVRNQIIVRPDVINVGLCYLTSSVPVARIYLQNNNRVMVPYEIKLPRELSRHVQLSHSKGYLKAESTIEVSVHLNLKYLHNTDLTYHRYYINNPKTRRDTFLDTTS